MTKKQRNKLYNRLIILNTRLDNESLETSQVLDILVELAKIEISYRLKEISNEAQQELIEEDLNNIAPSGMDDYGSLP